MATCIYCTALCPDPRCGKCLRHGGHSKECRQWWWKYWPQTGGLRD